MSTRTIPLILCAEEDVEGNHGASIGKLDDQTLFYLASRGIPKEEAEKMLARARVDALNARIPVKSVRDTVEAYLGGGDEADDEEEEK
ncbi:MAG: SufD family Fe-S cluster assembly protein [Lachnospiraceae bacterium]